jgi:hypothetical protein
MEFSKILQPARARKGLSNAPASREGAPPGATLAALSPRKDLGNQQKTNHEALY